MKTNKTKKGPLGTPLGNPLGYFNSQKAKRNEPLNKARDGRFQQLNDMNPNYTMDPSNGAAIPKSFDRPVKEGPLSEATDKKLNTFFPSTAPVTIPNAPQEAVGTDREGEYNQRANMERNMRQAGWSRPFKTGGATTKKFNNGGTTDPNKYVMNKTNVFGKFKHKEISKNKFDRVSKRYGKQEGSEQSGNSTTISQQVHSGRRPNNSVSRVDEVRQAAELEKMKKQVPQKPAKPTKPTKRMSIPPLKSPGPSFKQGGTTKAAKFAALAKPFDKATAADRIAGAKKNKRKKK